MRTINIIKDFSSALDELEIRFKGDKVNNLSVSNVWIGNAGRATIRQDDIASSDPVTIKPARSGVKILDSELVFRSNPANCVTTEALADGNEVGVSFEYLDRNDGAVLQVIHTGTSSDAIAVTGTVKGCGRVRRIRPPWLSFDYRIRSRFFVGIGAVTMLLISVIGFLIFNLNPPLLLKDIESNSDPWSRALSINILLGMYGSIGIVLLYSLLKFLWRRKTHPYLRVLEQELLV
jgi:hypothetical protein